MREGRIGREYYDQTDYFEEDAGHILDHESPFQRYRIQKVLELCTPQPEDRVLDIGCGWGTFSFALAPFAAEVVGIDFSSRSIDFCTERLARSEAKNVSFLCRDATETGLPSNSFDVVVAADLFEHLYPDDSEGVVAEAFRLLKLGGSFALWTPHRGHLLEVLKNRGILLKPDPTHVDYKSMARLEKYLGGAGFEIEKAYYAESHLPGLRALERMFLRVIPLLRRRIAVLGRKPE